MSATLYSLLAISLIIWLIALIIVIRRSPQMPTWALIIAIVSLVLPIPGGPILAIILAMVTYR